MTEIMDALLVTGVYMICMALVGLNVLSVVYMRQQKAQAVIVWDGFSTEVVRNRVGYVTESGNFEVFGDGELNIPLGLRDRAGEKMQFLLVCRQQVLAYE